MAFIKIDREIEHHWIYQDAEYFKIWFEILIRSRYSRDLEKRMVEGELIDVNYGQFIFGRIKWSERTGVSERRLRTLIDRLIREGMIQLVSKHRKCTVYFVVNFEKYNTKIDQQNDQQQEQSQQGNKDYGDQQNDLKATSERPADDQRTTTQEESKERKKVNKVNKEIIYSDDFDIFWDCYPKQIGKPAAFSNWKKLIKTIHPDYLKACSMNYASYVRANNTELQFIKQPNNFLNAKDEYYKQFETPVLIHSRSGGQSQGKQTATSKIQEMYNKALEDERREANGGY